VDPDQEDSENFISIAQDERNDTIPVSQQELIKKNQQKFKDF